MQNNKMMLQNVSQNRCTCYIATCHLDQFKDSLRAYAKEQKIVFITIWYAMYNDIKIIQ